MDLKTNVTLRQGWRLLVPALLVGTGLGLLLAGIATEIWGRPHVVGSVEVLVGIVVGAVGNLLNLASITKARHVGSVNAQID
jgi:hypothetical protein